MEHISSDSDSDETEVETRTKEPTLGIFPNHVQQVHKKLTIFYTEKNCFVDFFFTFSIFRIIISVCVECNFFPQ